jgi:hypothetical protein
MNSCPKVSLLTISIILATRLSLICRRYHRIVKWALRRFVLEIQIEFSFKAEKISVVPENQIF